MRRYKAQCRTFKCMRGGADNRNEIHYKKQLFESKRRPADDVSVVNAHSTDIRAGDPALELAVLAPGARAVTLFVASVKANLEHAGAASGDASHAKLLRMLRRAAVPRAVAAHAARRAGFR
ncbi:ketoacyl-synt-domain-containing protein [Phanerochaete sordida]|uniref:Ketoacyl-synt-domain-containing protein n=1 Tax=Phanerochaete sordida TaxID=48140 RepID=A0A9P3G225_9APHY|nr:ketoacyl-synt-domain-containing protein [Phanerochaete sordida]